MRAEIPRAAHSYIFGLLLGKELIERRKYDCDFMFPDYDGVLSVREPDKGLFARHREVARELTDCIDSLAHCYFGCPSCGEGPHCHPEDKYYVEYLQGERARLATVADRLKHDIEVLRRLADPDLMADVYAILAQGRLDDLRIQAFIQAAFDVREGYEEYRAIRKEAERLVLAIGDGASALAELIEQLWRTGVRLPKELRPPSKFETSILYDGTARSRLQMMRFVEDVFDHVDDEQSGAAKLIDLRTALLETVKALGEWEIDFGSPQIEAATSSRQNSRKSAMIRAFGAQIQAEGVKLDARIYRAMAITLDVVRGDAEAGISEDDVRKAMARYQQYNQRPHTQRKLVKARKTRASS